MENLRKTKSNGATHADALYSPNGPTTAGTSLQSVYNPPRYRGEVGWICPICGRGNAPSTAYCNCNMTKPDIVYANGGTTITSILDDTISRIDEYTTTTTISSNCADKGSVYGAHFDTHN